MLAISWVGFLKAEASCWDMLWKIRKEELLVGIYKALHNSQSRWYKAGTTEVYLVKSLKSTLDSSCTCCQLSLSLPSIHWRISIRSNPAHAPHRSSDKMEPKKHMNLQKGLLKSLKLPEEPTLSDKKNILQRRLRSRPSMLVQKPTRRCKN